MNIYDIHNIDEQIIKPTYFYVSLALPTTMTKQVFEWLGTVDEPFSPMKSISKNIKWRLWDHYAKDDGMVIGIYFKDKQDAIMFKMKFI